jgi:hypothetical protein
MRANGGRSRRCRSVDASIVLLLVLSALGCATGRARTDERVSSPAAFDFENSSLDPVAVYLGVQPGQWLLGYVEPRRRAHLRLPGYFTGSNHADVTVIVVPIGAQRTGLLARDITDAICSELVSTDDLSSMRWMLTGRKLISYIPPKRR